MRTKLFLLAAAAVLAACSGDATGPATGGSSRAQFGVGIPQGPARDTTWNNPGRGGPQSPNAYSSVADYPPGPGRTNQSVADYPPGPGRTNN